MKIISAPPRLATAGFTAAVMAATCVGAAGPGAAAAPAPASSPAFSVSSSAVPTGQGRPRLTGQHPCPGLVDVICASLTVPLDRRGRVPGALNLQVAMTGRATAPRGVLLLLTGGPGQPGVPFIQSLRERLGGAMGHYRLVMLDQRGTGGEAIECARLQAEVGSSDVLPPTAAAVRECASQLGPRRHLFTTADTVADLDDLRAALGVASWTLDGVSYGTFTAQQYALTHPRRVRKLVLDSVVPQDNADPLYRDALSHSGWVLRTACREQDCGFDPAKAVATVVRRYRDRYRNGVTLFDALVITSIIDPRMQDPDLRVLDRIRRAAAGDPADLDWLVAAFTSDPPPPQDFSAGLHAATLCADLHTMPWGNAAAPPRGRDAALRRAVGRIRPHEVWPFEPVTAGAQGIAQTCLHWPPSRPMPRPRYERLSMPVLLLAGNRDLSTPLAWAQEQAARTPRGRLVIVDGGGHSLQRRNDAGAAAAVRFLTE
jgi:pimeloyl-ACP methyl ester carboxylesterase